MADLIRIKGGSGDVPTLQDRELAYSKDEQALYIGTEGENLRLCGAKDVSELITRLVETNARLDEINTLIENINARLDALENPSE